MLSLLQHWTHQTPTSEEETPPVSSLVSQMGTATDTRVAVAQ